MALEGGASFLWHLECRAGERERITHLVVFDCAVDDVADDNENSFLTFEPHQKKVSEYAKVPTPLKY